MWICALLAVPLLQFAKSQQLESANPADQTGLSSFSENSSYELPIVQLDKYISATFLGAPYWAQEDMFNEANYANFYRYPYHDVILSDSELKKVKEAAQLIYEKKIKEYDPEGSDNPPEYTEEEQLEMERQVLRKYAPPGIRVMCFCTSLENMIERCSAALDWGDSVYIQINDPHNFEPLTDAWYSELANLKEKTGLKIYGLFFGIPKNWDSLDEVLEKTREVLTGVVVGVNNNNDENTSDLGCITDLNTWEKSGIREKYSSLKFSYFAKDENPETCRTSHGIISRWDLHVNHNDRDLKIPSNLEVLFPCYGGYEGRCFQAFNQYPEYACNPSKQRYVFAPYDPSGNNMLHMFNEVCLGLGLNLPSHDVVQAIL